jgi:hypothetical protein
MTLNVPIGNPHFLSAMEFKDSPTWQLESLAPKQANGHNGDDPIEEVDPSQIWKKTGSNRRRCRK